jgi:ADP-ribosyl-[dinitrogen reductase] hydrolase
MVTAMTDRLAGILLGTAVGDSLGLPAEGLSRRRHSRLMPAPWRHRLVFGCGMVSDDTEHALFVAQSLLRHPADPDAFQRRLAWHLRWWLASLPAGIGRATARACLRLWLGFRPSASGVWSAGNGPAMRSAILGGYFHEDRHAVNAFVRASTSLTHTHPRALTGAMAVARVAAWAVEHDAVHPPPADFLPGA